MRYWMNQLKMKTSYLDELFKCQSVYQYVQKSHNQNYDKLKEGL